MFNIHIQKRVPQAFSAIAGRIALPALLFSGSLFGLLFLSWTLLLPRFTHVERPDGTRLSPRQVAALERGLAADLTQAEEERMTLVRPVDDPLYRSLIESRRAVLRPMDIAEQLRVAAARAGVPEDALHMTRFGFEGDRMTIEGDIRNVGLRSMTVLAAFTDAVAALPFVDDLERPAYRRDQREDGSYHSPFTLSFVIHSQ